MVSRRVPEFTGRGSGCFPKCLGTRTLYLGQRGKPTRFLESAKGSFAESRGVIAWLNRDDRLLISIRNSFFFGSPFGQNSKVKCAQLGVVSGWVTDQEVAPGCARVRTKCAEKTSIDLWGQSRSRQE